MRIGMSENHRLLLLSLVIAVPKKEGATDGFPTSLSSSRWASVPFFNKLRLPADRTAVNKLLFFQHRHFKRHFNGSSGESTQHSRRTHEHFTGDLNSNHEPRASDDTSSSHAKVWRNQAPTAAEAPRQPGPQYQCATGWGRSILDL